MREKVTKFNLEDAFKTLDEIDIPKVRGIRANRDNISESFKRTDKFEAIFEEFYNINDSREAQRAQEDINNDIAQAKLTRIERIVDLDADSPEDLLPSYVGKVIIQCPQCMTMFYKNREDIEKSENDETIANVGEVCQHCGNDSGYTIIGKVAEETPEEEPVEEVEAEEETVEEEPVEEEPVEESEEEAEEELPEMPETEEENSEDINLEDEAKEDEEEIKESLVEENEVSKAKEALSDFIADLDEEVEEVKECDEIKECNEDLEAEEKINDYIEKLPEDCENCKEEKEEDAVEEEIKEDVSDAEFEAMLKDPIYNEGLEEEIEEPVETTWIDDGKGDAKEVCPNCGKEICECSQQVEEKLEEAEDEDFDDVEDFVEESFNKQATDYLTEVYENVESFETTDCELTEGKLVIEGNINFKSGKIKPTKFEFSVKNNKLCGSNKDLCEDADVFTLNYKIKNKALVTESLKYAYRIESTLVENLNK